MSEIAANKFHCTWRVPPNIYLLKTCIENIMRAYHECDCNLFSTWLASGSYKAENQLLRNFISLLGLVRLTFQFMIIRPGCRIISLIKYSSNSVVMLFTDIPSLINKWNSFSLMEMFRQYQTFACLLMANWNSSRIIIFQKILGKRYHRL